MYPWKTLTFLVSSEFLIFCSYFNFRVLRMLHLQYWMTFASHPGELQGRQCFVMQLVTITWSNHRLIKCVRRVSLHWAFLCNSHCQPWKLGFIVLMNYWIFMLFVHFTSCASIFHHFSFLNDFTTEFHQNYRFSFLPNLFSHIFGYLEIKRLAKGNFLQKYSTVSRKPNICENILWRKENL